MNVERMWQGAVAYYDGERATDAGVVVDNAVPNSSPATPGALPGVRPYEPSAAAWEHPSWNALNFGISSPHYYQYLFLNLMDCDAPGGGGAPFEPTGPFGSGGGPLGDIQGMPGPDGQVICQGHKSYVCHSGNSIAIGNPAVFNAHLNHGDSEGACDGEEIFYGGFFAIAAGNLDGDEVYSFFYRSGFVLAEGGVRGMPLIFQENPSE